MFVLKSVPPNGKDDKFKSITLRLILVHIISTNRLMYSFITYFFINDLYSKGTSSCTEVLFSNEVVCKRCIKKRITVRMSLED